MVTAKGKAQETCAAWLPSLFLAIPFLWYFRPEFPHIGFCLDICGYVVLAFLTAILETAARPPDNGTLETDARIRRLEESIKDWRGILFLSAGSYLVWAIYWLQTLWIVAGLTVEANADKWLLGSVTAIKVVIFSLWVMMGPIAAIFNGLKAHQDRLVALSD